MFALKKKIDNTPKPEVAAGKEAKEDGGKQESVLHAGKGRGRKPKTSAALIRAQRDLNDLEESDIYDISFPDETNPMHIKLLLRPAEGLWQDVPYEFQVNIPEKYPYEAPKVVCKTMIYHPNIDWEGHVCLNILREDWSPVLNLYAVFTGLHHLFLQPNPSDPLNKEAAEHQIQRPQDFEQTVRRTLRGGHHFGRQFPSFK